MNLEFYKGKKVFITGHTGFKGAWLCKMLINAGAEVTGYALSPPTNPSLFVVSDVVKYMNSVKGDIRDYNLLLDTFEKAQPEFVFHMAAQPLVRESYINPKETYEINVMGTVNLLECIRKTKSVKSFINITTDKVYKNHEWVWGYREDEELDGFDPYSNSKSCSELVTHSYLNSFFLDREIAISTARAGNVLGGGDFAKDRIIPDCIRSIQAKTDIIVRNPFSTRPYQHVLEPLYAYLMIAAKQYKNPQLAGWYNVGPDDGSCLTTGDLVDLFCKTWTEITGQGQHWINKSDGGPHEANFLKLDCSKLKSTFNWKPNWDINITMKKIVDWSKTYIDGGNVTDIMDKQIIEFFSTL